MKRRNKILITVVVMVAILLVSGVSIYAATNYGSQYDPLVTLSYLTDKFTPEINNQIKSTVNEKAAKLEADVNKRLDEAEDRIEDAEDSASIHSTADVFTLVSLSAGQKLICDAGTEMMLRQGDAAAVGSLADSTDGKSLADGDGLTANHMYMVPADDAGVKAAGAVEILVRGDYAIG